MSQSKRPVMVLTSYSKRKGTPDRVTGHHNAFYDARRVRNPWYDPNLRKLNGKDERVQKVVDRCQVAQGILNRIHYMTTYADAEYPIYVNVGCSGGRHRSVAICELIAKRIALSNPEIEVKVVHRDLKND
jgi:RNase adapter protein RapZ